MKDYILNLDKPRNLHFGFKAMRIVREKYSDDGNKELTDIMEMNVDEIPFFAYAGMVGEDKTLTPEKVEDLIDASIPGTYTMMQIVGIITKAVSEQLGVKPLKKKVKKKIPSKRSSG